MTYGLNWPRGWFSEKKRSVSNAHCSVDASVLSIVHCPISKYLILNSNTNIQRSIHIVNFKCILPISHCLLSIVFCSLWKFSCLGGLTNPSQEGLSNRIDWTTVFCIGPHCPHLPPKKNLSISRKNMKELVFLG